MGTPPPAAHDDGDDADPDDDAPRHRIEQQTLWVDRQVRAAMARGEFDNLPGAGKPLQLPDQHDPDWWVKRLIEREKITGVLPPALGLRKEDAELDATLDRLATEQEVRRAVEDFNRRVVEARRQLLGGPPVVTQTRDPEAEAVAWRERRVERRRRAAEVAAAAARSDTGDGTGRDEPRRRWWRRR
ncbi:DUF1992 domain-containing protein [Nocardioides mesophilus]|uniref:DUF1992 domain-containing protein n=2 Tax=Nocardioides mesophilus TaxID=433659 RepID=A0A7G9RH30_9ACTN|nr:DUF1992 domain-containing protein [Nocardioides mesophilus]